MASRGAREYEDGSRRLLNDPEEVAWFRSRAKMIYVKTFFATLLLILAGRSWLWFRG